MSTAEITAERKYYSVRNKQEILTPFKDIQEKEFLPINSVIGIKKTEDINRLILEEKKNSKYIVSVWQGYQLNLTVIRGLECGTSDIDFQMWLLRWWGHSWESKLEQSN